MSVCVSCAVRAWSSTWSMWPLLLTSDLGSCLTSRRGSRSTRPLQTRAHRSVQHNRNECVKSPGDTQTRRVWRWCVFPAQVLLRSCTKLRIRTLYPTRCTVQTTWWGRSVLIWWVTDRSSSSVVSPEPLANSLLFLLFNSSCNSSLRIITPVPEWLSLD